MLVKEFKEKTGFEVMATPKALEKEISGVFVGDLLSWVMGHSKPGQVWVTVQTHLNIVAVCALKDLSALVIASSAQVPKETLDKAMEEDIAVFMTDLSAYEVAKKAAELGC